MKYYVYSWYDSSCESYQYFEEFDDFEEAKAYAEQEKKEQNYITFIEGKEIEV